MHEPRPGVGTVAQAFEQTVDMPRGLAAPLHGDAGRLVEDEQIVVLVQGDVGEKVAVGLGQRLFRARRRRHIGKRRNADTLAGAEPGAGLGPAPSTRTWPVRNSFSSRLWGRPA